MLNLKKVQKLFLLFLVASIFIFIPLESTNAFINLLSIPFVGDAVESEMGKAISSGIVYVISWFIGIIIGTIPNIGASILAFVLGSDFINYSGAENEVVRSGWEIVRNLANAALIIGLVIIAINIILGREEGQAKKTLVNFIIAAILVNFTPVICGFIIDGSNILARSFVVDGISGDILTKIGEAQTAAQGVQDVGRAVGNLIFILIFSIVSFWVYILYSILFVARAIILWILIIASPIAVATKVFPKSNTIKKFFPSILFWDEWVENFVQWCIIAIPAGLFIFLANKSMTLIAFSPLTSTGDDTSIITNTMNALFEYMTPLIILIAGFFITISSGGAVAAPIGNLGRKALDTVKGAAVNTAKSAGAAAGTWTKEGVIGTAGALAQKKNPIYFDNRDSGRMSVENAKEKVVGWGRRNVKERLHFGKDQDYKTRSEKADKELTDKPEDYLKGDNAADVEKEVEMAQQRINIAEKQGDNEKVKKMKKALGLAMLNNKNISDERIEQFEKEFEVQMGDVINKMSSSETSKNLKDSALQRSSVARSLDVKQVKNIFRNGSTQQQNALLRGAKSIDLSKNPIGTEYDRDVNAKTMIIGALRTNILERKRGSSLGAPTVAKSLNTALKDVKKEIADKQAKKYINTTKEQRVIIDAEIKTLKDKELDLKNKRSKL